MNRLAALNAELTLKAWATAAVAVLPEILKAQFGLTVTSGTRRVPAGSCWLATVTLQGADVTGRVSVELPEGLAQCLSLQLLGTEHGYDDHLLADVTGELCNMVAGRIAATSIPPVSILNAPVVHKTSPASVAPSINGMRFERGWTCETFDLSLALQVQELVP